MNAANPSTPPPFYERMLFFAEGDLEAAEAMVKSGNIHYQKPCFDARECVEKALKAFIAAAGREVPQVHSLRALLRDCMTVDKEFGIFQGKFETLARYQSEARYPEADEQEEFTAEEAAEAVRLARELFDFVRDKIERRKQAGLLPGGEH
ncbi:MAG: HEPN domain-containing protein [Abditibacteriales bacterium]|nr:HEPN domain-containing protein [Abditibacteriales bacterium]MDW8368568.1 HEPN domain-containing protein [Abditibacteriales bacterium]